jgi:surfeit locus 1 family protein
MFAALGVWQVERLHWKAALIEQVEARLLAPPQAPPQDWSPDQVYTKVRVTGVFAHEHETLVQAVTERGPGWWVMTPLRTDAGVVLINRGFVPAPLRASGEWSRPDGIVSVVGLLRESEPNGAFLRANAPQDERWYSRDVSAIAAARRLTEPVAPFFIDADATPNVGDYPVGGLTIVKFANSHLIYAIIWFALAALALTGAGLAGPFRQAVPDGALPDQFK